MVTDIDTVDLFAGPGGWDEGVRDLGIEPLGIEWDDAACATRAAAGHLTLQADIAELDPTDFPCRLLLASPPCQAFSAAGKGEGKKDVSKILKAARELDGSGRVSKVKLADPRSMLVVEPLRWALVLRPEFIAFEQVPPVLALWKVFAERLREAGYSAWAGLLSAEEYGVPQTRTRAFLMASLSGDAVPPRATHQAFVTGEPAQEQHTLEGTLLPWVSMAEALGWDHGIEVEHRRGGERLEESWSADRPSDAVTSRIDRWHVHDSDGETVLNPGQTDTQPNRRTYPLDEPAPTVAFGHDAANWKWQVGFPRRNDTPSNRPAEGDEGEYRERDFRDEDEPAFVVTEKTRSWMRSRPAPTLTTTRRSDEGLIVGRQLPDGEGRNVGGHGYTVRTGMNSMKNSRDTDDMVPFERSVEEPAPTVDTKVGTAWKVAPEGEHVDPPHRWKDREPDEDEDAPRLDNWPEHRPATTVAGDPRVHPPGHKENSKDPPGKFEQRRGANAIRVTLEEAAVLQGFRPDYPWQGSRTKCFEQVGNAVPPPLARAVVGALLGA